ncbi:hypothetical protein PS645_00363 [Pseudomonas fluorescens]|jgi:hypothetical protein|uniref:Uncharacterized protein n=1 Tax=Pseudomonas fluorescens TaxID=294 RepID=A0A5E6PIN3_PSEFL|nr:hypothetical protein PS645_00363 [Pseudomonas fluorescens]
MQRSSVAFILVGAKRFLMLLPDIQIVPNSHIAKPASRMTDGPQAHAPPADKHYVDGSRPRLLL